MILDVRSHRPICSVHMSWCLYRYPYWYCDETEVRWDGVNELEPIRCDHPLMWSHGSVVNSKYDHDQLDVVVGDYPDKPPFCVLVGRRT